MRYLSLNKEEVKTFIYSCLFCHFVVIYARLKQNLCDKKGECDEQNKKVLSRHLDLDK